MFSKKRIIGAILGGALGYVLRVKKGYTGKKANVYEIGGAVLGYVAGAMYEKASSKPVVKSPK